MSDYMFHMKKKFVEEKDKSLFHRLKFLIYFSLFYFLHNIPFTTSIVGMLSQFPGNTLVKAATFLIGGFSSWWFHYMAHRSKAFDLFSGHRHHHKPKTTFFEDAHEFGSNIIAAGGALFVANLIIIRTLHITLLNNYVLLLFMFGFPLVHLLIYHRVLPESYHEEHHRSTGKNFSPDLYDHLFDTNLDNRIENLDHMIPVFAGVTGVLLLCRKYNVFKSAKRIVGI